MLHYFTAISDSSSDSEAEDCSVAINSDDVQELLEQSFLNKYNRLIEHFGSINTGCTNDEVFVGEMWDLLNLLNNEISKNNLSLVGSIKKLKFALMKNLADQLANVCSYNDAILLYIEVVDEDSSDFISWRKLGDISVKSHLFLTARYSYEQALACYPDYWHCLDQLISLLYLMECYEDCLHRIEVALAHNPSYVKGRALMSRIFQRVPLLQNALSFSCSPDVYDAAFEASSEFKRQVAKVLDKIDSVEEVIKLHCQPVALQSLVPCVELPAATWYDLGSSLVQQYDFMVSQDLNLGHLISLEKWSHLSLLRPNAGPESLEEIRSLTTELVHRVCLQIDESAESHLTSIAADLCFSSERLDLAQTGGPFSSEKLKGASCNRRTRRNVYGAEDFVYKRRSTRLVPGFDVSDFNDVVQDKRTTLREALVDCLPNVLRDLARKKTNKVDSGMDCSARTDSYNSGYQVDISGKGKLLTNGDHNERAAVLHFLLFRNCDETILEYLFSFMLELSDPGFAHWTVDMVSLFVSCFAKWKRHTNFSLPFFTVSNAAEIPNLYMKFAKVAETYCELLQLCSSLIPAAAFEVSTTFHNSFNEMLEYLSLFNASLGSIDDEEMIAFIARYYWTHANAFVAKQNYFSANGCLRELFALLKRTGPIALPAYYSFPSATEKQQRLSHLDLHCVEKLLKVVDRKLKLDQVRELILEGNLDEVVAVLIQNLNDSQTEKQAQSMSNNDQQPYIAMLCDVLFEQVAASSEDDQSKLKDLFHWLVVGLENQLKLLKSELRSGEEQQRGQKWFSDLQRVILFCDHLETEVELSDLSLLANVLIDFAVWTVQVNSKVPVSFVKHWVLLYELVKRIERPLFDDGGSYANEMYSKLDSTNVLLATRALMVLLLAHEQLGHLSCCTISNGELLDLFASEILSCLRDEAICEQLPSSIRDDMLNSAEQCFFCLYNYPQRRKRHLDDHNAAAVELSWERLRTLFDFVKPEDAPEFDDCKAYSRNSITQEDEGLFRKFCALVPDTDKPEHHLSKLEDYLSGKNVSLRPVADTLADRPVINEMYHLLADYNMKAGNYSEAKNFYLLDICINVNRFDSWAGLSLLNSRLLVEKFRLGNVIYTEDYLKTVLSESRIAFRSFQQALQLKSQHGTLWVEYGSTIYQVHSYISRFLKKNASIDREERYNLMLKIRQLLQMARQAYLKANRIAGDAATEYYNSNCVNVEEWLHHFMLGKIAQKLLLPPPIVLSHYCSAFYFLLEEGARFPEKIRYQNPQKYALESLEIYYRCHVAVLNWILQDRFMDHLPYMEKITNLFEHSPLSINEGVHDADVDANTCIYCLKIKSDPSIVSLVEYMVDATSEDSGNGLFLFEDSEMHVIDADDLEVSNCMQTLLNNVEKLETKTSLVQRCLDSMSLVNRRFPNHYKSLYWLARIHATYEPLLNLELAKAALVGPVKGRFKVSQGLFEDRKQTNFFNGIFRIPMDDIDRFGSLPTALTKSVELLIDVVSYLNYYRFLFELFHYFYRKPEKDKQYLNECEREYLVGLCLRKIPVAMTSKIDTVKSPKNKEKIGDLLLEVHGFYEKCRCVNNENLECIKTLLKDLHCLYVGGLQTSSKTPLRDAVVFSQVLQRERQVAKAQAERKRLALLRKQKEEQLQSLLQKERPVLEAKNGISVKEHTEPQILMTQPSSASTTTAPTSITNKDVSCNSKSAVAPEKLSSLIRCNSTPTVPAKVAPEVIDLSGGSTDFDTSPECQVQRILAALPSRFRFPFVQRKLQHGFRNPGASVPSLRGSVGRGPALQPKAVGHFTNQFRPLINTTRVIDSLRPDQPVIPNLTVSQHLVSKNSPLPQNYCITKGHISSTPLPGKKTVTSGNTSLTAGPSKTVVAEPATQREGQASTVSAEPSTTTANNMDLFLKAYALLTGKQMSQVNVNDLQMLRQNPALMKRVVNCVNVQYAQAVRSQKPSSTSKFSSGRVMSKQLVKSRPSLSTGTNEGGKSAAQNVRPLTNSLLKAPSRPTTVANKLNLPANDVNIQPLNLSMNTATISSSKSPAPASTSVKLGNSVDAVIAAAKQNLLRKAMSAASAKRQLQQTDVVSNPVKRPKLAVTAEGVITPQASSAGTTKPISMIESKTSKILPLPSTSTVVASEESTSKRDAVLQNEISVNRSMSSWAAQSRSTGFSRVVTVTGQQQMSKETEDRALDITASVIDAVVSNVHSAVAAKDKAVPFQNKSTNVVRPVPRSLPSGATVPQPRASFSVGDKNRSLVCSSGNKGSLITVPTGMAAGVSAAALHLPETVPAKKPKMKHHVNAMGAPVTTNSNNNPNITSGTSCAVGMISESVNAVAGARNLAEAVKPRLATVVSYTACGQPSADAANAGERHLSTNKSLQTTAALSYGMDVILCPIFDSSRIPATVSAVGVSQATSSCRAQTILVENKLTTTTSSQQSALKNDIQHNSVKSNVGCSYKESSSKQAADFLRRSKPTSRSSGDVEILEHVGALLAKHKRTSAPESLQSSVSNNNGKLAKKNPPDTSGGYSSVVTSLPSQRLASTPVSCATQLGTNIMAAKSTSNKSVSKETVTSSINVSPVRHNVAQHGMLSGYNASQQSLSLVKSINRSSAVESFTVSLSGSSTGTGMNDSATQQCKISTPTDSMSPSQWLAITSASLSTPYGTNTMATKATTGSRETVVSFGSVCSQQETPCSKNTSSQSDPATANSSRSSTVQSSVISLERSSDCDVVQLPHRPAISSVPTSQLSASVIAASTPVSTNVARNRTNTWEAAPSHGIVTPARQKMMQQQTTTQSNSESAFAELSSSVAESFPSSFRRSTADNVQCDFVALPCSTTSLLTSPSRSLHQHVEVGSSHSRAFQQQSRNSDYPLNLLYPPFDQSQRLTSINSTPTSSLGSEALTTVAENYSSNLCQAERTHMQPNSYPHSLGAPGKTVQQPIALYPPGFSEALNLRSCGGGLRLPLTGPRPGASRLPVASLQPSSYRASLEELHKRDRNLQSQWRNAEASHGNMSQYPPTFQHKTTTKTPAEDVTRPSVFMHTGDAYNNTNNSHLSAAGTAAPILPSLTVEDELQIIAEFCRDDTRNKL